MKKIWNAEEKLQYERALQMQGYTLIAGVDEVGRGPLAGPVVCAAVIMPLDDESLIVGVDDSKKLSEKKREQLTEEIKQRALAYTIVEIDEKTIDEINILEATKLGMKKAIESLELAPDVVLTDGNMTIDISHKQHSVIHGDALSYSIGAASIIAKVYRDHLMDEYAKAYPQYAFEKNKGYGTAAHIQGIKEYGLCPIHRRTFTKKF
ncbi:MAG: ribonuclease HII [Clostridia bacterium]|nr:ribonuclease HII [Clostridia bacterium]MBQ8447245.1 ribonuclease HII [Clostridia bacterium]